MKNHTKIYLTALGFSVADWVPCEISVIKPSECKGNGTCVDVHHIEARGMGGSSNKDHIANLMGLCRECHEFYGDKTEWDDFLQVLHRRYLLHAMP